eukprot:CAMPEP_0119573674 /NCGR_PEP_ID=MMETSP1352-20130426/45242_1 /TAXON_ID=265584 /ORGANISM="Stauroneis constricta, Strain CCMP1120" /LENGTH=553 /DNA_ID=CAMNT_0007623365 /DNA_START=275 /DNA_END=1936 /DNA_ORIENTATION=-
MASMRTEIEKFTDEIEGELEKRTICGIHITRRVTIIALCAFSIVIVALGVGLGTTLGGTTLGGGGGGSSGSSAEDADLSNPVVIRRIEMLETMLEPISGSSVETDGTPQRKALIWLAKDDPAKLPLKTTSLDMIEQRYILATLYFATDGPNWALQYNFMSASDVCDWHSTTEGIFCNNSEGYVTNVELNNLNLNGELPPDIALLPQLRMLRIGGNKLKGTFPSQIGLLKTLNVLDVGFNHFEGELPSDLGHLRQLEILDVSNNDFSGPLHSHINNIQTLQLCDVSHNDFVGTLHDNFGNFRNLQIFRASYNQFSTTITKRLADISTLEELLLDNNQFKGEVPAVFASMPSLAILDVSSNLLSNTIPTFFGLFPRIQSLGLANNQFEGPLISEIGNLGYTLEVLRLNGNNLKSFIPLELGELTKIQEMNFEGNQLEGNIPSEIGQCSELKYLSVAKNELFGDLPTELGQLSELEILDISYNNFGGDIPPALGNQLSRLKQLYLPANQFRQDLDPIFCNRAPFEEFLSDCKLSDVKCSCCTMCCNGDGEEANCSK